MAAPLLIVYVLTTRGAKAFQGYHVGATGRERLSSGLCRRRHPVGPRRRRCGRPMAAQHRSRRWLLLGPRFRAPRWTGESVPGAGMEAVGRVTAPSWGSRERVPVVRSRVAGEEGGAVHGRDFRAGMGPGARTGLAKVQRGGGRGAGGQGGATVRLVLGRERAKPSQGRPEHGPGSHRRLLHRHPLANDRTAARIAASSNGPPRWP
jgi:hypothetical protein